MHYYDFHIKDYHAATAHLSNEEDLCYRRLLDMYYETERPIPKETEWVSRRLRVGMDVVSLVLRDFFFEAEDGWHHDRIDAEIGAYHTKVDTARTNGKLGGRPKKTQSVSDRNLPETEDKPDRKLTNNHKPITNNQYKNIEANASVGLTPTLQVADSPRPICPADDIINLYHELMPLNPRCKVLNDARRKTIRARWKEAAGLSCDPFGYSSRESGLAAWREFFAICAESPFLTGRAPAQPGKPPFVADIDFLMSPSGFAKCLENKYHREVAA